MRPSWPGDVGHVGLADERDEVVLAERLHRDVPHHDHLVVAGLERDGQVGVGLLVEPEQHLGVHPGHPRRRVAQAVAVGVLADGLEDLADRLGDAVEVHRGVDGRELAGWASRRPCGPPALGVVARTRRACSARAADGDGCPGPRLASSAGAAGATADRSGGPGRTRRRGRATPALDPAPERRAPAPSTPTGCRPRIPPPRRPTATARGGRAVRTARARRAARSMPAPLSMSPNTSARSASSSVSFSTSDVARRSSVARWVVRMKRARSWACVDQLAHLVVDQAGDLVGVGGLVPVVLAEEHLARLGAELLGAEPVAHAVGGDHRPGRSRCSARCRRWRRWSGSPNTSSSAVRPPSSMVMVSTSSPRVFRYLSSVGRASVHPSARPRDTIDTLWMGSVPSSTWPDQRVAALVVGDDPLLLVGHDPGLALGAGQHPVDGALHGRHRDVAAAAAGREQRRLVHEVGEVGAGEAGRAAGQHVEADVVGQRLALGVDVEDRLAALEVGLVDHDLAVEAPGPQQRRVEDVGPVGGGDEDDAGAGVEPVHLDQQLVEGLLALVVAAAHAGAAVAADGVDLVDEHDGGRRLLGLLEQVADPAGADADEHLDEVGARDGEERHAGLAGHGPGEQGLAGARRAVEQHALGDAGADGLEAGGVLQELLDLLQLLDRLVAAGDVGEGDRRARPSRPAWPSTCRTA